MIYILPGTPMLDYGAELFGKMTAVVSSGDGVWGPLFRVGVAPEMKIDNQSECLIAVLDYSVNYDKDTMSSKGVVQFMEDKRKGKLYFKVEGSKWGWQQFGFSSQPQVYYLVKSKLTQE